MTGINNLNLKLIYKASIDGFSSSIFHLKCDNQNKTISVIKSQFNFMFGGYTDINFESETGWK